MKEKLSVSPEPPDRLSADIVTYEAIMRETGGKFYFCDNNIGEPIPPFTDAIERASELKPTIDSKGNICFIYPVEFRGSSYVKTIVRELKKGREGAPTVIVIPGYGNIPQSLTIPCLTALPGIAECCVVGIEVFHGLHPADRVKVGSRVQNLQAAFASAMTACNYAVQMAHERGSKVLVLGSSFGAKTINAILNNLAPNPAQMAERYLAIQGGNFIDTFCGPHIQRQMLNPDIVNHPSLVNGSAFPYQASHLPDYSDTHITAYINPTDNVAPAQGSCWDGADEIIIIQGRGPKSHLTTPLIHISKIRRTIAHEIQSLRVES